MGRWRGQAAADADELMYLEQQPDAMESLNEDAPADSVASLYDDLLGADNLELDEAAEWGADLMNVTELDEVEALLEKVLPDPAGFGRRLLLQVMARLAQVAEPGGSASFAGAKTVYATAEAGDVTAGETVIASDQPVADETPVDTNMLLAAALGA